MSQSKVAKLQEFHDRIAEEQKRGISLRLKYQEDVDALNNQIWEITNEITACERQLIQLNQMPNDGTTIAQRGHLNQYLRTFRQRHQDAQEKLRKRTEKYAEDEKKSVMKVQELTEKLTAVKYLP